MTLKDKSINDNDYIIYAEHLVRDQLTLRRRAMILPLTATFDNVTSVSAIVSACGEPIPCSTENCTNVSSTRLMTSST